MKSFILLFFICLLSNLSFAQLPVFGILSDSNIQHTGLFGRILANMDSDSNSQDPLPFADVAIYQKGKLITGVSTDLNGWYFIPLAHNEVYDLNISYVGFKHINLSDVKINGITQLDDIFMEPDTIYHSMQPCDFYRFFGDGFSSGQTLDSRFIRNSAIR